MKINALRKELNTLIAPEDDGRKPAVRRSLREEWLYATNLPAITCGERLEAVRRRLSESGWESIMEGCYGAAEGLVFRTVRSGSRMLQKPDRAASRADQRTGLQN